MNHRIQQYVACLGVVASLAVASYADAGTVNVELTKLKKLVEKRSGFWLSGQGSVNGGNIKEISILVRKSSATLQNCIFNSYGSVSLSGRGYSKGANRLRRQRVVFASPQCVPHLRPVQIFAESNSVAKSSSFPNTSSASTQVATLHTSGNPLFFKHAAHNFGPPLRSSHFLRFTLSPLDSVNVASIELRDPKGRMFPGSECHDGATKPTPCLCPKGYACSLYFHIKYKDIPGDKGVSLEANAAIGGWTDRRGPGLYKLIVNYKNGSKKISLIDLRAEAEDVSRR